jgi:D-3-phosphoglycerate dehydrogenase
MLAVARRIVQLDADTRGGKWPRGQVTQLRGKTLGIVGLGAVGREFARLGVGIGMRVIAWTIHPNPALGFPLVSFEELLRSSDVLSIHLRLSPDTKGLIGWPQIEMMKPSAILINTARGAIVDEAELVKALSSRRIAGAGLDVFDVEPLPLYHPLTVLDNAVLTPHSAGITPEAVEAGLQMAVQNIWDFLRQE